MRNLLRAVDVALDETTDRLAHHKDRIMDSAGLERDSSPRVLTDEMFDDMDNRIEVILYTLEDYYEHPDEKVRTFVNDLKNEIESVGQFLKGHRKWSEEEDESADFDKIEKKVSRIREMLKETDNV